MTFIDFDQAQHAAWAEDFENEAEREEREATMGGQRLLTDSEFVGYDDIVAEDWAAILRDTDPDEFFAVIGWDRDDWAFRS